jgi:hypothetical protein
MPKKKAFYEYLPIYNVQVFYCSCPIAGKKLAKSYIKHKDANFDLIEEDCVDLGFVTPIPDHIDPEFSHGYLMYVAPEEGAGVVCHESNHLKNFIFAHCGVQLDLINDEPESYLTGYITDQFFNHIRGVKAKSGKLKRR